MEETIFGDGTLLQNLGYQEQKVPLYSMDDRRSTLINSIDSNRELGGVLIDNEMENFNNINNINENIVDGNNNNHNHNHNYNNNNNNQNTTSMMMNKTKKNTKMPRVSIRSTNFTSSPFKADRNRSQIAINPKSSDINAQENSINMFEKFTHPIAIENPEINGRLEDIGLDENYDTKLDEPVKFTFNTHMNSMNRNKSPPKALNYFQEPSNPCAVTVYGFPLNARAEMHRKFAEYGRLRSCRVDENALHIIYDDVESAYQALTQNGYWIEPSDGSSYLIGVKYSEWIRPHMDSNKVKGMTLMRIDEVDSQPRFENKNIEKAGFVQEESLLSKFVSFWTQGW